MTSISFDAARKGFHFRNQTKNLSKSTIDWYDGRLEEFGRFLASRTGKTNEVLPVNSVKADDIRAFIADLQARDTFEGHPFRPRREKPLSPFSVRGYVRALASFFSWAKGEHYVSRNPMEGVEYPKVPKTFKKIFSREDIEALLKACAAYPEPLAARDRSIILFLLSTGVRAAELCTLTMQRLDPNYQRVHITGKGSKDRYVVLGVRAREALWKYIHVYRPQPQFDVDCVFLTKQGKPIRTNELNHVLRRLGERAGVVGCNPHRFRHTFASMSYKNGMDVLTLQALLGHSSLETTRIYTRIGTEDLERESERTNPVDRWGL